MSAGLPQARVVKKGGITVAPPPVPLRERLVAFEESLGPTARTVLSTVVGLWPVTAVVALAFGLAYLNMMSASP